MATYNPPNYTSNNQFIPTFNSINYSDQNIKGYNSLEKLDNRYLKKISDDSTPYDLTVDDLTVNGNLSLENGTITQLTSTNSSTLTTYSDSLNSRKINVSENYKTYEEYGYNMWSYLDFSSDTKPGFDASGNSRDAENFSANIQASYNNRTNVCLFTQPNNQSIAYSNGLVQRLSFNDYISTLSEKTNVSISFWVYFNLQIGPNCIFCAGNRTFINHQIEIWVGTNSNTLVARVRNSTGAIPWQLQALLNTGWNHCVLTMGSAGAKLYLNGALIQSSASTDSFQQLNAINPITDIIVGSSVGSNIYRWTFNGAISDFIIWDEQISDATVLSLYNESWLGYKILVLSGQSNMVGRGFIETGIDDDYSAVSDRVKQFPFVVNMNSDGTPKATLTISEATNPLDVMSNIPFSGSGGGKLAGTMACWLELCKYILPYLKPREKILLLPCSRGGSGFNSNDWNKGDTLYNAMVNAVNASLNMNSKNKLQAFFWLQGENDSGVPYIYGNYLKNFYSNLLVDMNQFNTCPFIVSEINGSSQGKIYINNVLKSFTDGNSKLFVKASGLQTNTGDTTHFSNVGLREIGRRFGYQIANYLKNVKVNPYSINTTGISIDGTDNNSYSLKLDNKNTNLSICSLNSAKSLFQGDIYCSPLVETFDSNRLYVFPPYGLASDTTVISHSYCNGTIQLEQSDDWFGNNSFPIFDRTFGSNYIFTYSSKYSASSPFSYVGSTDYFSQGATTAGAWVKMTFPENFILKFIGLYGVDGGTGWTTNNPRAYRIYATNNGSSTVLSDWTLVLNNSTPAFTNTLYQFFNLTSNTLAFNTYMIIVNSVYGNSTLASIGEIFFYGYPKVQNNLIQNTMNTINRITSSEIKAWGGSSALKNSLSDNVFIYTPISGGTKSVLVGIDDSVIMIHNTQNANIWVVLPDSKIFTTTTKVITIKDIFGNAGTYNIGIKASVAGEKIDGATISPNTSDITNPNTSTATVKINANYGYLSLCVCSLTGWHIIGK